MSLKISIITVAYNAEKTIEDTIKSVINQTYSNIEYIVIDGQSKDATLDVCRKFESNITKLVSEPDKGIYDAMNKGIALATGDVIGILNSDDFYANESVISKIVTLFDQKNVDGVYADLVYVDPVNTDKIIRKWVSGPFQKGAFLKGWMPPHPTFFVRKDCYKKYGDYSLELKSAADYEMMLRLIHKHEINLGYLNEVIVKMRAGGVSNASLKNRIKANKEDRQAWKMNGLKPAPFTLIRKPLSKIKQYFG